jgi:NAD-dependent DNA ligase
MNFRLDYAKLEKAVKTRGKPEKVVTKVNGKISIRDKFVVVTGTIPGMTRLSLERYLGRFNCIVDPAVATRTDFLIVGKTKDSTTSKMIAATTLRKTHIPYLDILELQK